MTPSAGCRRRRPPRARAARLVAALIVWITPHQPQQTGRAKCGISPCRVRSWSTGVSPPLRPRPAGLGALEGPDGLGRRSAPGIVSALALGVRHRVPTRFVQKYTARARLKPSGAHEAGISSSSSRQTPGSALSGRPSFRPWPRARPSGVRSEVRLRSTSPNTLADVSLARGSSVGESAAVRARARGGAARPPRRSRGGDRRRTLAGSGRRRCWRRRSARPSGPARRRPGRTTA